MSDLNSVYSHSPSIVTRKTGTEYVLVPISNNIADMNSVYTLNETGAFIWDLIDGKKSVREVIEAVVAGYETDYETAAADVFGFMEKMSKYLIVTAPPVPLKGG